MAERKGHMVLTLLVGPAVGLAYVIVLPAIALATVVTVAGEKVVAGMLSLAGKSVSFGWRPTTAFLSGRDRKRKDRR